MKKHIHFSLLSGCLFIITIITVCQSFSFAAVPVFKGHNLSSNKVTTNNYDKAKLSLLSQPHPIISTNATPLYVQNDSLNFEVKMIKPRKFLLSFYKKHASDIFIKIYDVLGNLVHQEKVSKKGKFKKEYDLSGLKPELYVIEVGDSTSTITKRLFMG